MTETTNQTEAAAPARAVTTREHLVADIAEGIRVLNRRGLADISEADVDDRARNIAAGILGNYTPFRRLP